MTTAKSDMAARPSLSRTAKLILGGTALIVVILRVAILDAPTLRDEGLYGYIAQEVLRGYLPMETALDNKGPVLFYVEALALALFGFSSIEGIRAVGILFILGSGWTLFQLGREMRGERLGLIAMGLFAFETSLVKLDGHYYASEFFTMLPGLASAWMAWRAVRSPTAWPAFLSGLLLGLAIWTRLTLLTWAVSLACYLLWAPPPQERLPRLLAFFAGATLVTAAFLGLYAWHGELGIFVDAYSTFPSVQVATGDTLVSEGDQLLTVARRVLPQTILLWLPLAAALWSWRSLERHVRWFLLPWLAMAVAGFWITHLYLPKQTFLLYPPICLLAAYQLEYWSHSRYKGALSVLIALNVIGNLAWNAPKYLGLLRGDPAASVKIVAQAEKVSSWVKANTKPDDYFYNWGVEWEVYFRSERRSPTRHMNVLLFVMFGIAVEKGAPVGEEFDRLQQEVIAALEAHPPEIIAVTAGVKNYDMKHYYLAPYFQNLLHTKYDLLFQEEPFWIFRRKPAASLVGDPQELDTPGKGER